MQSLRVGISPVLESLRHVGVCPYSLHYYTLFTAVLTAVSRFLPGLKSRGYHAPAFSRVSSDNLSNKCFIEPYRHAICTFSYF